MTYFPKPPFNLNDKKSGDRKILNYLKRQNCLRFKFLSDKTRKKICKLELDAESLFKDQKKIFEIWPYILTDALRELKRNDPREWEGVHQVF